MADLRSAGFKLGAMFGGGGTIFDTARTAEEKRLIEVAAARAETDRKVDQAIEEQQKRQAIQRVLADPTIPDRDKNFIVGELGSDYAATMQGNLRGQEMGFRGDAVSAALAGRYNDANANLFGVAPGPVRLTDVDAGQVVRNPFSTEGVVAPTNVAESQAAANYARANLSSTKAAAGGFAPRSPAGGRAAARTEPTSGTLSQYFADDAGKINRERVHDFQAWRLDNPEIRDGDEAVVRYAAATGGDTRVAPVRPEVKWIDPPSVSAAFGGDVSPPPPDVAGNADAEWQAVKDTPSGRALAEARAAVAKGAPVESVRERLRKLGYKNIASRL